MKKRTICLILIWIALCLIVAIIYPTVKESCIAKRSNDAIGGEYFLWLVPSEIVFALSMFLDEKGRADG